MLGALKSSIGIFEFSFRFDWHRLFIWGWLFLRCKKDAVSRCQSAMIFQVAFQQWWWSDMVFSYVTMWLFLGRRFDLVKLLGEEGLECSMCTLKAQLIHLSCWQGTIEKEWNHYTSRDKVGWGWRWPKRVRSNHIQKLEGDDSRARDQSTHESQRSSLDRCDSSTSTDMTSTCPRGEGFIYGNPDPEKQPAHHLQL